MRLARGVGVGVVAVATVAMLGGIASQTAAQSIGDTAGTGRETAMSTTGEQTYREICQACHMANAEGGQGAGVVPALARNAKLADADFVLSRVVKGQGGMPAFADMLSPEQVAGVINYVRTHFGNAYPTPVTVETVKKMTPASSEE